MPVRLHRMIYCSRPRPGEGSADQIADEVATHAARANRERDVTGLLMTHPDWFLQVLEGRRTDLSELTLRIGADRRHTSVQLIVFEPAPERAFSDWGLAVAGYYEALWRDLGGPVARYVGFDPFASDAESLLALVTEAGRRLRLAA